MVSFAEVQNFPRAVAKALTDLDPEIQGGVTLLILHDRERHSWEEILKQANKYIPSNRRVTLHGYVEERARRIHEFLEDSTPTPGLRDYQFTGMAWVHKNAKLHYSVELRPGAIIGPKALLNENAIIGRHLIINGEVPENADLYRTEDSIYGDETPETTPSEKLEEAPSEKKEALSTVNLADIWVTLPDVSDGIAFSPKSVEARLQALENEKKAAELVSQSQTAVIAALEARLETLENTPVDTREDERVDLLGRVTSLESTLQNTLCALGRTENSPAALTDCTWMHVPDDTGGGLSSRMYESLSYLQRNDLVTVLARILINLGQIEERIGCDVLSAYAIPSNSLLSEISDLQQALNLTQETLGHTQNAHNDLEQSLSAQLTLAQDQIRELQNPPEETDPVENEGIAGAVEAVKDGIANSLLRKVHDMAPLLTSGGREVAISDVVSDALSG